VERRALVHEIAAALRNSLKQLAEKHGARDSTARGTALAELAAMKVRTSQYNPAHAVPEKNWLYRLAKRFWFNDFGVYQGHDHTKNSAPALLQVGRSPELATLGAASNGIQ